MRIPGLAFIVLSIFLVSCASRKESAHQEIAVKPAWVQGKPISGLYYSGIGMAYKTAGADFISIAKNNALNDLASEISVTVSSSSFFYQIEKDDNLRAEFQANTKLKSKENLEGFELVETYENANEYWVYYRLEKQRFADLKKLREQNAIALSKQYYLKAVEFKEVGQITESLKFGMKAISAVKDYLADPLFTEFNGKEVFLIPELYSFLQSTLSSIVLLPAAESFTIVRGQSPDSQLTTFTARSADGKQVAALPLFIFYSADRLQNNQVLTDIRGVAVITLPRFNSRNEREYLQANVNMVALVTEATDDPFMRKFLSKMSASEARIELRAEKPVVQIISTEKNLGNDMPLALLANAYRQKFMEDGFLIANGNHAKPNYIFIIKADTRQGKKQNQFESSILDATFQLLDQQDNLLYEQTVPGFMGMQLSPEKAGEDAYKKLAAEISRSYYRDMRRKVFD